MDMIIIETLNPLSLLRNLSSGREHIIYVENPRFFTITITYKTGNLIAVTIPKHLILYHYSPEHPHKQ